MIRLRHAQLQRFSDVVWELGRTVAPAMLSDHLLHGISRLIDVDRISYNEVDRVGGRLVRAHSMGEPPSPSLVASLNSHIHEHPGFSRPDSNADWPAPTKLSDTLSQREFRQLGLYREHFKLHNIHYQLGANFAVNAERKISFGLNRQKRDFTEEDRLLMALICPHLARVHRQARAAAEVRAAFARRERALDDSRTGLIFFDEFRRVEFANARAAQLLQRRGCGFGRWGSGSTEGMFPPALTRWFQHQTGLALSRERSNPLGSTFVIRRASGELRCQLVEERSVDPDTWQLRRRWLLKLSERPGTLFAGPLLRLGLSPREAEVLMWLAQGKRNAEIAAICRMRPSTVSTHVRNIFPKLGVETRTAAAAVAWETLTCVAC